jgi:hypothetical protein
MEVEETYLFFRHHFETGCGDASMLTAKWALSLD